MRSEKINWKLLVVVTLFVVFVLNLSHVIAFVQCAGGRSRVWFSAPCSRS